MLPGNFQGFQRILFWICFRLSLSEWQCELSEYQIKVEHWMTQLFAILNSNMSLNEVYHFKLWQTYFKFCHYKYQERYAPSYNHPTGICLLLILGLHVHPIDLLQGQLLGNSVWHMTLHIQPKLSGSGIDVTHRQPNNKSTNDLCCDRIQEIWIEPLNFLLWGMWSKNWEENEMISNGKCTWKTKK